MIAFLCALSALSSAPPQVPAQRLSTEDVVWTTPSVDAIGSMPLGNGEVVLNAWVEQKTGDLRFYIARTDALSEISRVLKLGGIRVHMDPSPFVNASDFKQHLHLQDGELVITAGGSKLKLFVDSSANRVEVLGESGRPLKVTASVECWRNSRHVLTESEQISAWSVHNAPFILAEEPDVFLPGEPSSVTWYHRNETTVVPQVLANQSLTGASGAFDPILHRTFGGRLSGEGFRRSGPRTLSKGASGQFHLTVPTYTAQTNTANEWLAGLGKTPIASEARTLNWWHSFWNRSWVFVSGDHAGSIVPKNEFPLRRGVDSNGQNVFPGKIEAWRCLPKPLSTEQIANQSGETSDSIPQSLDFSRGFTLSAWITPDALGAGRIFDNLTAGQADGFLFDIQPGGTLRLICGDLTLTAAKVIRQGERQYVAAVFDPSTAQAALYLNGKLVAGHQPLPGSSVTRGWTLQRYVQACQGRGEFPIKFNGGYYTVEPTPMGRKSNPDWRNWGDSHWYQNVRHMYHPMPQQGDFDMMSAFFRLYEKAVPLAKSRSDKYHNSSGVYFPETMTVWGTYSSGDYGWDRTGKQPKDVDCQYWQYAWNQGPELVNLMLDYWDYTQDKVFLKQQLIPMAKEVLAYFRSRFKVDATGKIILDPTQVVETYWHGVVNDMPTVSGLISITGRLCKLPKGLVSPYDQVTFSRTRAMCPELPFEVRKGERQLSPAQKYNPDISNVENGELYGVWPSRVVDLGHPQHLAEAKVAYKNRLNHLDTGWGYDGNVAALLGMTDEASRILLIKCANSHPAYRWPATWGPNFDWLPDQNHGGNLLNTTNLMLMQSEALASGGTIRLFPAWPKSWDVDFKLHAPGNTTVHAVLKGGVVKTLEVSPVSRRKDVVFPSWLKPWD